MPQRRCSVCGPQLCAHTTPSCSIRKSTNSTRRGDSRPSIGMMSTLIWRPTRRIRSLLIGHLPMHGCRNGMPSASQSYWLRLGDSWAPKAAASNISLVDAEHLSTAFVQLVRHLNDGWGGGRAPPPGRLRIRYIEVWNEPEGAFWTGSLPAFYRLLTLTIHKLRAYDGSLRVGPNNASPYGENGGTLRKGFELTALDAVLNATTDARLRPTLYSWHAYIHQNPTLFETLINETRARLDARGLVDAEQVWLLRAKSPLARRPTLLSIHHTACRILDRCHRSSLNGIRAQRAHARLQTSATHGPQRTSPSLSLCTRRVA